MNVGYEYGDGSMQHPTSNNYGIKSFSQIFSFILTMSLKTRGDNFVNSLRVLTVVL